MIQIGKMEKCKKNFTEGEKLELEKKRRLKINFLIFAGRVVTRRKMGLPSDWSIIESWTGGFSFGFPILASKNHKVTRYDGMEFTKKAEPEFWSKFPSRDLPKKPTTSVRTVSLKNSIRGVTGQFTCHEQKMAEETIQNLLRGAPALQRNDLKACLLKNAESVIRHGAVFTATLETWIKSGYVAGPFMEPPTPEFRANSLMAVEQKDKVRPVLNMSYPKGGSFNCNIDKDVMRKVKMSSASQFGQSLLKAGRGAYMSKMDMKDAYKMVPARTEDFRLQGFQWLGAFFCDTQQIFGAATAVANFDDLGATVLNIVLAQCDIPRYLVHRTLDDVACVAPESTSWCQDFTNTYKELCKKTNILFAEDCPNLEKAFSNQRTGTVLGIQFNSKDLTWRIPDKKSADILADIHNVIHGGHVDLKQLEVMAGRLNNFGQMCPFLQAFKRPLNILMTAFKEDYDILLPVEEDLIEDLRVWAAVVTHADGWLPIPTALEMPALDALEFVSDAAGGTSTEDWEGLLLWAYPRTTIIGFSVQESGQMRFCQEKTRKEQVLHQRQQLWRQWGSFFLS